MQTGGSWMELSLVNKPAWASESQSYDFTRSRVTFVRCSGIIGSFKSANCHLVAWSTKSVFPGFNNSYQTSMTVAILFVRFLDLRSFTLDILKIYLFFCGDDSTEKRFFEAFEQHFISDF